MLINRFREDDVQVTGQKLDGGGARFEIFFNGQCVFSKVVYDILFNTLKMIVTQFTFFLILISY